MNFIGDLFAVSRVGECDPIVSAAMAYIKEHLDSVTAEDVSRAVSVSQRPLRRQF